MDSAKEKNVYSTPRNYKDFGTMNFYKYNFDKIGK